jgi:hypothetical protein
VEPATIAAVWPFVRKPSLREPHEGRASAPVNMSPTHIEGTPLAMPMSGWAKPPSAYPLKDHASGQ